MKKLVTTLLVVAMTLCALNFSFMSASAETVQGDSPNLITTNPSFTDGVLPFFVRGNCNAQVYTQDSQDADGHSCYISERTTYNFSSLGYNAGDIIRQQGAGNYVLSFWVRTANSGESVTLKAASQIEHLNDTSRQYMQHSGSIDYTVDNNWVQIVHEFTVVTEDRPTITNAIMYMLQENLNADKTNMYDLITDNWSLIKKGSYIPVSPDPVVDPVMPDDISNHTRASETEIGAIYYNPWTGTSNEWKENGEIKVTNDETARSLSPSQFHYMAPFYADVDSETNRVIFPQQTLARWKEEMQYAINGGITHINYLWGDMISASSDPIKWHMQNTDINSQIGMCGMIENIQRISREGFNALFDAMKSEYWVKYNNMPVVYLLNGVSEGTETTINYLRTKAAVAGITEPLYIIGMGYESQSTAIAAAANGVNAASFYAAGARATAEEYSELCEYALSLHENLLGAKNVISVAPMATMGRNNNPRIVTPVSWSPGVNGRPPYGGYYTKDGTPRELAQQLLDVLNWNKENADACRPNIVTMYAWNEFDEGGWLCPTLVCDENGNVQRDENGNPLRDTSHIDAIRDAIALYREHEDHPTRMVDVDGNTTDTLSVKKNDIKSKNYRYSNLDDWSADGTSAIYNGSESAHPTIRLSQKTTIAPTQSGDASHGNVIRLTQAGNQNFEFDIQSSSASDKVNAGVWKVQYSVFVPLDATVSGSNQFWITSPINYNGTSFNAMSDLAVAKFNYLNYTLCQWGGSNWLQAGDKTITPGVWKTYTTYMFAYDLDNFPITLKINKSYPAGTEIDNLSAQFVCSFDDVNAAIESGALNITEVTDENKTLDEYQEPKRTNAINLANYLTNNFVTKTQELITVPNDIKTTKHRYSNLDDWSADGTNAIYNGSESAHPTIRLSQKSTIAPTQSGDASHGNVIRLTQAGNQSFEFDIQSYASSDKVTAGVWKVQYSVFVPLDATVSGANQFWITSPINYNGTSFNAMSDLAVAKFNYLNYTLCQWGGSNWLQAGDKTITPGVWKTYTTYMFAYDLDNFPITLKINKSYPAGTEIDNLSAQFVCSFDDVNAAIESGALNITEVTDENKALDEYQEPKRTNAINLVNYLIANYSDEAEVVSGTGIKASIKVNNEEATTIEHYSVLLLTAEAGEDTAFDGWYYDGKLVSSNASYTVYTDPAILAKLEARFKSA